MYRAARNNYETVIKILFNKGIKIDIQNKNEETVLFWIAKNNHEMVVKSLLDKKTEVDI